MLEYFMDPTVPFDQKVAIARNRFYDQEAEDNKTVGFTFAMIMIISLLVIFYAFKSINVMCPGSWGNNPIKFFMVVLLLGLSHRAPVGVLYIIAAYLFKVKFNCT